MTSNNLEKSKSFLIPIVSLVILSIIAIALINTYLNISIFKQHIYEDIEKEKKEYLQKNKEIIYKKVHFADSAIKFQKKQVEKKLKQTLRERVEIALKITSTIYNKFKGQISNQKIREKVIWQLQNIDFNNDMGYYIIADYKTNIVLSHREKEFIKKDMTNYKDAKGNHLISLRDKAIKNNKIGFYKVYSNKPNDTKNIYLKFNAVTLFKPLNIVIGNSEYFDSVEKQLKEMIIDRFSNMKKDKKRYLFFLDLHNIDGGENFATIILNGNRPDLVGKKIPDTFKGAKGKEFVKEYLQKLREKGEGYSKYWFKKPNSKEYKSKISYFYLQKDWNWILGSGFYFDDLEKQIDTMEKSLLLYSDQVIKKTIIWVILLSIIIISIAVFISIRIDKTIKKYTDELKLSKDKMQEYINLVDRNIITSSTDLKGYITKVSQAFCDTSGYTKKELIGKSYNILRHPDTSKEVFKELWDNCKNNKVFKSEIKNLKKDRSFYWIDISIYPIYNNGNEKVGYTSIGHDISDKKIIEKISITDGLTNIYNRRYFNEQFPKIINSAKRNNELVCFLIMDIDHFKQYNDTYGHQMGDDVLIKVASSIKNFLHRADDTCYRLGGEEFGLIFKSKSKKDALKFSNKVRGNIENLKIEHKQNSASDYITASMGLVCKYANDIDSDGIIYKEADDWLYDAKDSGRNKVSANI